MRVERPGAAGGGTQAPDVAQEFVLAEHAGRIGGEDAEEGELLPGQVDLALADRHLAPRRVDQDLPHPDRLVVAAVTAAQGGRYPRPQLVMDEGSEDKVVGASVEVEAPIRVGPTREDDDRQARVIARLDPAGFADLAHDVQAVGQRRVEDQQVGMVVAAGAQRVRGARRRQDLEAVRRQVVAQIGEGVRVALADDDRGEDPRSRHHRTHPRSRPAPPSRSSSARWPSWVATVGA